MLVFHLPFIIKSHSRHYSLSLLELQWTLSGNMQRLPNSSGTLPDTLWLFRTTLHAPWIDRGKVAANDLLIL
jgi:hypothetical protein